MSLLRRLRSFDNDVDFGKGWRIGYVFSGVLLLVCVASLVFQGLALGLDFKGGTAWQFPANDTSVTTIEDALSSAGVTESQVQTLNSSEGTNLRVEVGTRPPAERARVEEALAQATGNPVDVITANRSTVGPSWGRDITEKAVRALIVFLIAIAAYISIRLEWRMAVGALVSVVHDLIICVGVYSVFQFQVTPATVIAFLTILGFSLYDTLVVFDKAAENAKKLTSAGRLTYTGIMNLSLNQVIVRSLNTSVAALLPVLSILVIGAQILGAVTLQEFGSALFVGTAIGAYSSIFVAAPVVVWLKEREPRYRQLRQRIEGRAARLGGDGDAVPDAPAPDLVTAGGVPSGPASDEPRMTGSATAGKGPYSANHPPRPRKKKRR